MPSPECHVAQSGGAISISGCLDFTTARSILSEVSALLVDSPSRETGANSPNIIDLAGVTSSNSAGLAVMIEWLAIAQRSNQEITFQNIPDSLRQISTVCQVDSLI